MCPRPAVDGCGRLYAGQCGDAEECWVPHVLGTGSLPCRGKWSHIGPLMAAVAGRDSTSEGLGRRIVRRCRGWLTIGPVNIWLSTQGTGLGKNILGVEGFINAPLD